MNEITYASGQPQSIASLTRNLSWQKVGQGLVMVMAGIAFLPFLPAVILCWFCAMETAEVPEPQGARQATAPQGSSARRIEGLHRSIRVRRESTIVGSTAAGSARRSDSSMVAVLSN